MKRKVFVTDPVRREVAMSRATQFVENTQADGRAHRHRQVTSVIAEFEGRLEVYIDIEKLIGTYAITAMSNKQRRFIRGPVEVRVIDMAEVPGTRKTVVS